MKQSAYHAAHGLAGTLKLTATGEAINFHFPKGEDRLHVQCNVGGLVSDAWLVAERVETGDDRDVRLTLVVQGARHAPVAKSPVVVGAVVSPTAPIRPVVLDVDGMPTTSEGGIHEAAPAEPRTAVLTPEERARYELPVVDAPSTDASFGTPGDPFSARPTPVYVGAETNTPIPPAAPPIVLPAEDAGPRTVAQDAAAAQALADGEEPAPSAPTFGPGPTNPGNVNRSVRDGMVQMENLGKAASTRGRPRR